MGIRRWLLGMLLPRKKVVWDGDSILTIDDGAFSDHDPENPNALYYVVLRPKIVHEVLGDVEPQALLLQGHLKDSLWCRLAVLFTSLADGTYVPEEN